MNQSFEEWMDQGHQELSETTGSDVIYMPFESADIPTHCVFVEAFGSIEDSGFGESEIDSATISVTKSNGTDEVTNPSDKDRVSLDGKIYAIQRILKETAGRVICRIVRHIRKDISAQGSKTRRH